MRACRGLNVSQRQQRDELEMGTIIEFPADAAFATVGLKHGWGGTRRIATILILPVIRIEREPDETSGGSGPEEGTAPGRRRRRR